MAWFLRPPRLLLVGQGTVAEQVAAGLRRGARQFAPFADLEAAASAMARARVLMLVDPTDPSAALAQLTEHCCGRPPRRGPLRVVVIAAAAATSATSAPVQLPDGVALTLERFDLDQRAVRRMLARWPLHLGADPRFGQAIHLLIAGRDRTAEALLVHTLRSAHYSDQPTWVTLLDADPQAWAADFAAAHPQAGTFSRVRFLGLDDPSLTAAPPVTLAAVFIDPPERGLDLAQGLALRLASEQQVAPPILLDVGEQAVSGRLEDWDGQIIPVACRREVLTPEVLLDARGDEMAQIIHGHYRDSIEAQGRDPGNEAAAQPWRLLAASYRDANRHQADHLWAKLVATDCRAVAEDLVESFAFAPREVERLALIEHDRWAADRWLDGWTYAPVRDNARKHHPQLIPYQDLSEPMKDLDRYAVRLAPTLLARSGLGVVRMLIIGLAPAPAGLAGDRLARLIDQALTRFRARFPARGLIIASTLADAPSRLFARRALDDGGTGLFLLCPRPLAALLADLDATARRELLWLAARAERRIPLPGADDLDRWLHERAEVLVTFGSAPARAEPAPTAPKSLVIDPQRGLDWGFEY